MNREIEQYLRSIPENETVAIPNAASGVANYTAYAQKRTLMRTATQLIGDFSFSFNAACVGGVRSFYDLNSIVSIQDVGAYAENNQTITQVISR